MTYSKKEDSLRTYLGNESPLPGNDEPFHLVDLVAQLGRTKRFGGWGNPEWTVLHHSMLCALLHLKYYTTDPCRHALLHDGHEAVTGDMPSPVKRSIPELKAGIAALEKDLDLRLYQTLGIAMPTQGETIRVKVVDFAALCIEGHYFGTPGVLERIVAIDTVKLDPTFKEAVANVIRAACPEVLLQMVMRGFVIPGMEVSE